MIEEITHILLDPAHLLAEFMFEGMFFLAGIAYTKWQLRKRDKVHNHEY